MKDEPDALDLLAADAAKTPSVPKDPKPEDLVPTSLAPDGTAGVSA